jgi:hypothetical protein
LGDVIAFLEGLTSGEPSTPDLADELARWQTTLAASRASTLNER